MEFFKKNRSKLIVGSVFLFPVLFYFLLSIGKHSYTRLSYYAENQIETSIDLAPKLETGFFINQNNDSVFVKENIGKITIWNVLNTQDYLLTPSVIANMQFIQERFKDRNELQFFSLISNHSTQQELQDFISKLNIKTDNWQLIVSDSASNNNFAKNKLYLNYKKLPDSLNQVVPSVQVVLVDQNLRIRGYFDGAIHKEIKEKLVDAIDMLIREQFVIYKEKSNSKITR